SRTFLQLDRESDAVADLLQAEGLHAGDRVLLAVRPGRDLIVGMFGLLKLGAVPVAIDPGMGPRRFLACVASSAPVGVVGSRAATLLSRLPLGSLGSIRVRLACGGKRWRRARSAAAAAPRAVAHRTKDEPAAILFTSGSTGAPQGVRYDHGMFDAQIGLVRSTFDIRPGEVDMAMLPLFALFNPALGVTTVTPALDPSRPMTADAGSIVSALLTENVTTSFGSPAIWGKVADHCETHGITLPSLRRLLIAGAPVSGELLTKLRIVAPNCATHTPYGATECLPVTTVTAEELLGEARQLALRGDGTCVGRPVDGVEVRVIRETDRALGTLAEAVPCGPGETGEIIATGPSVTREYDALPAATRLAKLADGPRVWHRMGDLGRIAADGRLYFLGRRAEKVRCAQGDLPTECIEPAFRQHPLVARCALIGLGEAPDQTPCLVVEPRPGSFPETREARERFTAELRGLAKVNPRSDLVREIVFQRELPVDVRHNAKIHRLRLAEEWTARLAR
ncbi:MAG: fatty acid CoA ligase family protein, partial [Opitutia bacterium]